MKPRGETEKNVFDTKITQKVPESPIRLHQTGVRAILDKRDLGVGILYISEATLCWQERGDRGFSITYPKISLHAISKDVNIYSSECVYVLLDGHITLPSDEISGQNAVENEEETDEFSDAESEPDVSELILVPENVALVPLIYESIKVCQELNPDPNDVDDDDDEEDAMFADAEDMMEEEDGSGEYQNVDNDQRIEEIAAQLENQRMQYSNNGHNDDDQFEDAD